CTCFSLTLCLSRFSLHDPPTTAIYTLSLHDALPIFHRHREAELHGDMEAQKRADALEIRRQSAEALRDGTTLKGVLGAIIGGLRSEEHTSELQSRFDLVCRLLLEKKKKRALEAKAQR